MIWDHKAKCHDLKLELIYHTAIHLICTCTIIGKCTVVSEILQHHLLYNFRHQYIELNALLPKSD